MSGTDRYDELMRGSIVALFFIVPLAVIVYLITLLCGLFAATPPRNTHDWFRIVISVDPGEFDAIHHYTAQGIDFSHHFKFVFDEDSDVDAIISANGMNYYGTAVGLDTVSLPEWYDLKSYPTISRRFQTRRGDEVRILFIDDDAKIAFFEMHSF